MNPHNGNCPWLPTNATPSPCGYQKRSCHVPRSPCAATTAATADAGAKSPTQPWQNGVCFMPERIPSAHHTNFAYLLHASLGFIKKNDHFWQDTLFVQVYVMCLKAINLPIICVFFFRYGFKLLKKVQVTISLVTIHRCYCCSRQTFCSEVVLYICLLQLKVITA